MIRNLLSAAFSVLLLTASAQAGLLAFAEPRVNPGATTGNYAGFPANTFTPDTAYNSGTLSSTWVSYALGLVPTAGTKIAALEVTLSTQLGPSQGFSQRYTFNEDVGDFAPTPSSLNVSSADSHLIVSGSQVFVAPNENKFEAGGPPTAADTVTNDYGVGTLLNGLWGFSGAEQAAQADGTPVRFAYLVVPRGSEPYITIRVNAATTAPGGGPGPDFVFTDINFTVLTPPTVTVSDKNLVDIEAGTTISTTLAHFPTNLAWTLQSFTGPNGAVSGATVDFLSGLFSWNSVGAPLGNYTAEIRGASRSLGSGSDSGLLSFNLVVPEPATLSLLGLSLAGLGFIRRR